jgi:hypothetical protein
MPSSKAQRDSIVNPYRIIMITIQAKMSWSGAVHPYPVARRFLLDAGGRKPPGSLVVLAPTASSICSWARVLMCPGLASQRTALSR